MAKTRRLTIVYMIALCLFAHDTYSKDNQEIFNHISTAINKYQLFMQKGTLENQDWSTFSTPPQARDVTFKKAFELFAENNGKTIVELGTTRSFVHGGLPGCNSDDVRFWTPNNPENWDWGAGCFTRVAAECLAPLNPIMRTIDLAQQHINRCKIITAPFAHFIHYHVCSSLTYLANTNDKIDLLYMDTGDMTPIEPTAQLQLEEARLLVSRDLIASRGLILIDDVRNQTPKKFGEESDLGKAKYALPYLLEHGFEIIEDEYQVLLQKID